MMPLPNTVKKQTLNITSEELILFMNHHGLSKEELADILGVTWQAVRMWLVGDRVVNVTISKLIRLFDRKPFLMREF